MVFSFPEVCLCLWEKKGAWKKDCLSDSPFEMVCGKNKVFSRQVAVLPYCCAGGAFCTSGTGRGVR